MNRPTTKTLKPVIRCAIYTRKSSEEGLDLEFNSLDAQREAAEAFIASQKAEGWTALPDRYDDGGYSGGSMERPALDRLIRDITSGKVDCVVVYKVDRLSRSLLDFSRIMETFDKQHVDQIANHLQRRQLVGFPWATWVSIANDPLYVPEHLARESVFTSVLTVTYRAIK